MLHLIVKIMHLNNKCTIINLQCTISSQYKIMHMKESKHMRFEVFNEVLLRFKSLGLLRCINW